MGNEHRGYIQLLDSQATSNSSALKASKSVVFCLHWTIQHTLQKDSNRAAT